MAAECQHARTMGMTDARAITKMKRSSEPFLRGTRLLTAAVLALASGCDVGPKYQRPTTPLPPAFKEAAPAAYRGAPPETWAPAQPQDTVLKGKWWEIFHEPELNALEEQLNISNLTIAQYFQNFMAARAQVNEARAGYFPTVAVSPEYIRYKGAAGATAGAAALGGSGATGTTAGSTTAGVTTTSGNYFVLPAEASWAPDLWNRVRNTVREYRYAAQVSAADLENERLTEQALLAQYFFELRGQDALQDMYTRTLQADRESLDFTLAQAQTGVGADLAVVQAQVTLANAEAQAVGVAVNRALYEHAIGTLIGKPASQFTMPVKLLTTRVPAIPIGLPSQLLQRRPDIAAAERTLAQANALIGVGIAAYYPSLNLTASAGFASTALDTLFSAPAFFWSLGASLSETVFDGGLRSATVAQYKALYKADVAAYRLTVLTAFQQVEDYVAMLRVLSQEIARQDVAVKAAQRYVDIAIAQYQTGTEPYLNVLTAQTTLLSDQQTLITLRVSEMIAAVQLVQALGGGWENRDLSQKDVSSDETARRMNGR